MATATRPVIVYAPNLEPAEAIAASMRSSGLPTVLTGSPAALQRAARYGGAAVVQVERSSTAAELDALRAALEGFRPVVLLGSPSPARDALGASLGATVLDGVDGARVAEALRSAPGAADRERSG